MKTEVHNETKIAGEIRKLCKAEGKRVYASVNETEFAFAESTIQYPGKLILPLHGRFWTHVLSQIDSIRDNAEFYQKFCDRLDTEMS